jgi:cytochrome c5
VITRSFSTLRSCLRLVAALTPAATGCSSPAATPAPAAPPAPAAAAATPIEATAPDDARGARLYDNWRSEKGLEKSFVPDSPKTVELDGQGGPNGNGTLADGAGKPLANTGHDYRLKNLFGWDLRGAEGIYGAEYQKKATVLPLNLLTDTRSPAELRELFARGGEGTPAYGSVLDARDLDDLVAFLVKTRARELVHPEGVLKLEKAAPKGFVLLAGGDAARGKSLYASSCSKCHGDDGRKLPIDETESAGSIARSSGYEIWFKIAHGQPGTNMGRQVPATSGAAQTQAVLDVLAALCDRRTFPPLAGGKDVPDGDARCGAYLR